MKVVIYTLFLFGMSLSSIAQVIEEENYAPMSTPSSPSEREDRNQQEENRPERRGDLSSQSTWDRLRFGGNLQLSFGSITFVEVSPRVGYLITENLVAGAGVNFIYQRTSSGFYFPGSPAQEFTVYGTHFYGTYNIPLSIPVALHGELELLNFEVYDIDEGAFNRQWVPALYLGGGIYQSIGRSGAGAYIMVLYNVIYDPDRSLIQSPWSIRFSFLF